jgi:hypothetical protein
MSIPEFLATLQGSNLASTIRDSLYLFPLLEATHVIGFTMVFGTITVIDLRLLGLASTRRPFSRIASEILKWTWAAFALTVTTGLMMFITNAGVYYNNFFFRSKMVLLALAGINMLMFELTAGRSVSPVGHIEGRLPLRKSRRSSIARAMDHHHLPRPLDRLHNYQSNTASGR